MKTCTKCHRRLPLTEFYRLSRGGLRSQCRGCCSREVIARQRERTRLLEEQAAELEALREQVANCPLCTPADEASASGAAKATP